MELELRKLQYDDHLHELQNLCNNCDDFYHINGFKEVPSNAATEVFKEHPPGISLENKIVFGLYQGDNLIGMLEMIKHFPKNDTWYVGQMMISKEKRGSGIGTYFFNLYENWCKKQGANTIDLAVLIDNEVGFEFWKSLGFQETKRIDDYETGDLVTTAIYMQKHI